MLLEQLNFVYIIVGRSWDIFYRVKGKNQNGKWSVASLSLTFAPSWELCRLRRTEANQLLFTTDNSITISVSKVSFPVFLLLPNFSEPFLSSICDWLTTTWENVLRHGFPGRLPCAGGHWQQTSPSHRWAPSAHITAGEDEKSLLAFHKKGQYICSI